MSALAVLLADRDRLEAEVKRLRYSLDTAVTHRDQAVKTCERRTAERDEAQRQLREMAALVNQRADLEHGEVGL